MINSLKVENFQCHEAAELGFHQGVNVIAGTSDSGKSALLKALIWVLTNKPQGLAFRRFGVDKGTLMKAAIETEGHCISRARSEQVNEYRLDDKKFVAMKADMPSDIQQAHGLEAINIQTQFVPHYLLSATSGEVARALNEACDLSIIDRTIKAISSISLEAKREAKAAERLVENLGEQLDALGWVDDAQSAINSAEKQWELVKAKRAAVDSLSVLAGDIDRAEGEIASKTALMAAYGNLAALADQASTLTQKKQAERDLRGLIDDVAAVEERLSKLPPSLANRLDALEAHSKELQELYQGCCHLTEMGKALRQMEAQSAMNQAVLSDTQQKLREAWAEQPICPLCGQPVKQKPLEGDNDHL